MTKLGGVYMQVECSIESCPADDLIALDVENITDAIEELEEDGWYFDRNVCYCSRRCLDRAALEGVA